MKIIISRKGCKVKVKCEGKVPEDEFMLGDPDGWKDINVKSGENFFPHALYGPIQEKKKIFFGNITPISDYKSYMSEEEAKEVVKLTAKAAKELFRRKRRK